MVEGKDNPQTQLDATLTAGKAGTPISYTQEQVDKQVRDARSAVLADAGRARKAAEDALARLSKLEKAQEEAELEAVRDDPGQLSNLRERQRRRGLETELAQARQELSQRDESLKQLEGGQRVKEIATRFKVDQERLEKLARLTDGTAEAIETIAQEMPRKETTSLKPDSGGVVGGSLNRQQIIDDYIKDPRNLAARGRYFELRRQEGR